MTAIGSSARSESSFIVVVLLVQRGLRVWLPGRNVRMYQRISNLGGWGRDPLVLVSGVSPLLGSSTEATTASVQLLPLYSVERKGLCLEQQPSRDRTHVRNGALRSERTESQLSS